MPPPPELDIHGFIAAAPGGRDGDAARTPPRHRGDPHESAWAPIVMWPAATSWAYRFGRRDTYHALMEIRIIDAFTDRAFAGNPAAVCFVGDTWPADTWMGKVSAEFNLPMTAFACPLLAGEDADWHLRWFLPAGTEQSLCGHATLAAAHALFSAGRASGTVRFRTRGGLLVAHARGDGSITLDFPAATITEVTPPDGLREALRMDVKAALSTGGLRDLLCIVNDEAAVRGVDPDVARLADLTRRHGIRGVILTAACADADSGIDYVSRFFAPADGLSEDPVTGSAHTALGPYWSRRLGRDRLVGLQASARTGVIRTSVHGDRVHLTGHAVTVVEGTLHAVEGELAATNGAVTGLGAD